MERKEKWIIRIIVAIVVFLALSIECMPLWMLYIFVGGIVLAVFSLFIWALNEIFFGGTNSEDEEE